MVLLTVTAKKCLLQQIPYHTEIFLWSKKSTRIFTKKEKKHQNDIK